MNYAHPIPVEISHKLVRWLGQRVRLVRISNEPGEPSGFVDAGELPEEDPNANVLDRILAELPEVLPPDGIPAYLLSDRFFPPIPAGLEQFPVHAYENDTEGWTLRTMKTTFH